jgi:hypothetical protein
MRARFSIIGTALALAVVLSIFGADAAAQGVDGSSLPRIRAQLGNDRVTIASESARQEVAEVAKRRDSPWNGFLVGAALGAAIGFGTFTECEPVPPARTCEGNLTTSRGMETVAGAALFAAVGMTVDLLMDRSTTVARTPASRRGVSVTASPARVQAQYRVAF